MKSRDLVYLFFSTLIIAGISSILIGVVLRWEDIDGFVGFLAIMVWLFGYGVMWSLISQMGFFAYLTVHRFGIGMFRSSSLWNKVQVIVIAFILFDLFYLRYAGEDLLYHLLIPVALLGIGLIVAFRKKKETNKEAFIPTLFFIIVVTTLEWIPALRSDDQVFLWLSFVPLMTANIWQVLTLHRLQQKN